MIFLFSMPWYYLQLPCLLSISTLQAHLYHKGVRNLIIMVVVGKKKILFTEAVISIHWNFTVVETFSFP